MKNLFFICLLFIVLGQNYAQGCPPTVWCHPDGEGLGGVPTTALIDGLTNAANVSGKVMNEHAANSGCDDDSWDLSCIFADWLPCGYGENTPQHTLCDDGGEDDPNGGNPNGNDPNGGDPVDETPPPTEEDPQDEGFYANPTFTPMVVSLKGIKKNTRVYFNKMKRGTTVQKWKNGMSLVMVAKFYPTKSKKEFAVRFKMLNSKGKVIGQPILFTSKNRVMIHDLVSKKKKKRRRVRR